MLRNFIITFLRILWRNRMVSAINIISLSLGITVFILILLYVHHETSFDKFNANYDRIYRLEGDDYAQILPVHSEYISDKIPDIEEIAIMRIRERPTNCFTVDENNTSISNPVEINLINADSTIFNIFSFNFIKGNPDKGLREPNTAVLTQSTAEKLFGQNDPIGKTIYIDNTFKSDNRYQVTGVIEDVEQAHFQIGALMPALNLKGSTWTLCATYLLLSRNADPVQLTNKINSILAEISIDTRKRISINNFHLRPLKEIYLDSSSLTAQYGRQGNRKLIWSFLAIAFLVLLLAIINYLSLTTARSTLRSKEVVVKKAMGSDKGLLRIQFVAESVLITTISFLLALTAIQLLIHPFSQVTNTKINLAQFNHPIYWVVLLGALLVIGIISGFYPAIILTSFHSVANKDKLVGMKFRKVMLTFQFSIGIVLIIGVITILRQLHFVQNADLGFSKEQILIVNTPNNYGEEQEEQHREAFKNLLLQYPNIRGVAYSGGASIGDQNAGARLIVGDSVVYFKWKCIEPEYQDLMEMNIVEGRKFSKNRISDITIARKKFVLLLNETAARKYWSTSPVGNFYYCPMPQGDTVICEIIGVVKDMHFRSLHHQTEPMMYWWSHDLQDIINIKITSHDISATIKTIENEWKKVYDPNPFVYSFLDETYAQQYKKDERAATIITYFTIIAISIACMGLFALSSFMAVRRTKEIGIRKSLGASSKTIFMMLSKDYIKWILLSAVIATPIAWWAMNKWLESFAYRIKLGPDVFVIAALLALAIGLITVGWQALKSAVAKPVDALQYE